MAILPKKASKRVGLPSLPHYEAPRSPEVVLVLGGGGARGMAHLGVLYELEQAGIPIDFIVGCSGGSIAGALYADRPDALELKQRLETLKRSDLLDYSLLNGRYGLIQGQKLRKAMEGLMEARVFSELKIPFVVVSTDLHDGEQVILGGGPVIPAVHASSAVPFYFKPVELYGRTLVDGATIDPVPTAVAREHGAKIVVAVDLSDCLEEQLPANLFGVALRSYDIMFRKLGEHALNDADIVIRPQLPGVGVFDDTRTAETFEAGRDAAKPAIRMLKQMLQGSLAALVLADK